MRASSVLSCFRPLNRFSVSSVATGAIMIADELALVSESEKSRCRKPMSLTSNGRYKSRSDRNRFAGDAIEKPEARRNGRLLGSRRTRRGEAC